MLCYCVTAVAVSSLANSCFDTHSHTHTHYGLLYTGMSCPLLKARVSKLEDRGLVADFQARLTGGGSEGAGFVRVMEEAHAKYAAERWQWLTPEDVQTVEKNNWVRNLVSKYNLFFLIV